MAEAKTREWQPKRLSDIPKAQRFAVKPDGQHSGPAGTVGVVTQEPLVTKWSEDEKGRKTTLETSQKFYVRDDEARTPPVTSPLPPAPEKEEKKS